MFKSVSCNGNCLTRTHCRPTGLSDVVGSPFSASLLHPAVDAVSNLSFVSTKHGKDLAMVRQLLKSSLVAAAVEFLCSGVGGAFAGSDGAGGGGGGVGGGGGDHSRAVLSGHYHSAALLRCRDNLSLLFPLLLTLNVVDFSGLEVDDVELDRSNGEELRDEEIATNLSSFSKATVSEQRSRIEREDCFRKEARERKKKEERESVLEMLRGVGATPSSSLPSPFVPLGKGGKRPLNRWMNRQRRRQREDHKRRQQEEIFAAASDHGSIIEFQHFSTFKTSLANLVASRSHARLAILCPAAAVPRFIESVSAALLMHP